MRLLGFINVFNQNPTFLQPVYWDDKLGMACFQHSEDKVTISSFEQADLEYYIKNSKYIVYPEKDIFVQPGSTVIFAVYVDGYTFWGDYLDMQNTLQVFINNKEILDGFPGFYNTCAQFVDEYKGKRIPDVKIKKTLENVVIRSLFDFCSYSESNQFNFIDSCFRSKELFEFQTYDFTDCKFLADTESTKAFKYYPNIYTGQKSNRPSFVDLYFQNKIVPKLWTVDVVKDLIFSLSRIRKTEDYVRSLLYFRWGLDISAPLTPFREDLSYSPDLAQTDIDSIIEDAILSNNIENLYIIDFLKIKAGHVLIAEDHFTRIKFFVATRLCGERNIEQLFNGLMEELLKNETKKLYLVINSLRIEKVAKQSRSFVKHSDKIRIIELPISNRLEMRHM